MSDTQIDNDQIIAIDPEQDATEVPMHDNEDPNEMIKNETPAQREIPKTQPPRPQLKGALGQVIQAVDTKLETDQLTLCLIATVLSFVGGAFIFIFKPSNPVARKYGMQSFLCNGIMFYIIIILLIASAFAPALRPLLYLGLAGGFLVFAVQVFTVLIFRGNVFKGLGFINKKVDEFNLF